MIFRELFGEIRTMLPSSNCSSALPSSLAVITVPFEKGGIGQGRISNNLVAMRKLYVAVYKAQACGEYVWIRLLRCERDGAAKNKASPRSPAAGLNQIILIYSWSPHPFLRLR